MTNLKSATDIDVTHAALTAAIDHASVVLDAMEREGFDSNDAEYQIAERYFFELYDKCAALDDVVLASGEKVPAQHYAWRGTDTLDLWYGSDGTWTGLTALTKDGTRLVYERL